MKQILLTVAALAFASPVFAQVGDPSKPYDFEKPMITYVDVASKAHFDGWSGNCNSGRLPQAFTVYRVEPGTLRLVNVPVTVATGPRRDAATYLAATCGRPFDVNVGWSLVPKTPEPPGEFEYIIWVTDIPASWVCKAMPPGYPNSGQTVCDYMSNVVYRIVQ